MKTSLTIIAGLLVGLASLEAQALCVDGTSGGCQLANGCPGVRECNNGSWGGCESVAGSRACTVCSGAGTQQCNSAGQPVGACTRSEQCNNCDDDQDGQVDEGLSGCSGVTCGHVFEVCGDGLDNDCDGTTDDGCDFCTTTATGFPYAFDTQMEMRRDTVNTGSYGRLMDSSWGFLPSHRMISAAFAFDQFSTEASYDVFSIGSSDFSGIKSTPFTTPTINVFPSSVTPLSFSTDSSVQNTGVRMTNINARCGNGGGNTFATIGLNNGVDGILLHDDDNAYVKFTLPAWREAFISLDHTFGGGTKDFNMFVTWGSTLFGTSCGNSNLCGVGTDGTGEVVYVPPHYASREIKVNINSFDGYGRYRLFVASPVSAYANDVDLAFEGNVAVGSSNDLRAKAIWGHAQRHMMSATDGQYRIRSNAYVTRNVSCFSCYDVVFSEDNDLDDAGNPCVPAQMYWGAWGYLIEVPKPVWSGATSWTAFGTACSGMPLATDRVGEMLVHEWGHYDFDLADERVLPNGSNRCGFSLMAGSGLANFTGGNNHFEFCQDGLHGMNPASGASAMGGNSNWVDIISDYPSMVEPNGTGDFSRLMRLGEMMSSGSFVSFEEN